MCMLQSHQDHVAVQWLELEFALNVGRIVRNIKLHLPPEGKDLIDIDASTKIWIDHCDLSSAGLAGVDKDTYDGMLDAKHGSDYLTFSWNKFHDHVRPAVFPASPTF